MGSTTVTESLLRRDRWIVGAGLTVICLLAWVYVIAGAGTGMSTLAMTTWQFPPPVHMPSMDSSWDWSYWTIMLFMWWVMMIAMMVPSAAPMILLYAQVHRHAQKQSQQQSMVPTAAFAGGYMVAWLVFSMVAVLLQWGLEQAGVLHTMLMWSTNAVLSGCFLIAAGLYQLSPLKNVCLNHCRSPILFLSQHWRKTHLGAFRMGLEHGLYCVGCCWFLMALLFVGGIMNLVWIAGLAIFVLLEKLSRYGVWIGRVSGVLMMVVGLYLVL